MGPGAMVAKRAAMSPEMCRGFAEGRGYRSCRSCLPSVFAASRGGRPMRRRQLALWATFNRPARLQATLCLAVLVAVSAGCGLVAGSASPKPVNLGVSNGTDLTVGLYVNGAPFRTVQPKSGDFAMDTSTLPPMPWNVEARSPSGRVLLAMNVTADQIRTDNIGVTSESSARVDLSCGSLRMWAGDIGPSGSAADSSPGQPGDCIP
jgi:hypothetical protein